MNETTFCGSNIVGSKQHGSFSKTHLAQCWVLTDKDWLFRFLDSEISVRIKTSTCNHHTS